MARNKLYLLLLSACMAGYIWLIYNYNRVVSEGMEPGVCLIKRVTGIPCPSCGTTRSVLSILHGDFYGALLWNPFGIIIVSVLLIGPLWVFFDILLRRDSFYQFYVRAEIFLRRKWIAIPAILLVLLNWIWNLIKGL